MNSSLSPDEPLRLEALRQYEVLDTSPEDSFDDLALLAAHICQTPIALVSFVDESRHWFKSRIGMSAAETPREIAFCAHTILHGDEVLEVRDARSDPRFMDSPLVTSEPHVRFYAGAPLVTPGGHALGALCVMDRVPRALTADQLVALRALSRQVVVQLEIQRQSRELANESAVRRRAETLLRRQLDQLSAGKQETDRLLSLAHKSRRALLSVLEDEKRAVARVREQADMLDHAHEAITVRDIQTRRITFWSKGAERLYGWTAAEAEGQDAGNLVFADPAALDAVTRHVIETGEWRGEQRHLCKTGQELTVSSHVTLVRDSHGLPKSALVITFDITGQKKLEEQFLRAQRMESIGTLASGVAHDLNNILSPILMAAPILRDELPPDLRDRIVTTIEISAQRGADIVKQVLTFARGVQGERLLVQPAHLVEEMAKIAQETFPKSITVIARHSNSIWAVEGDPTQLHQVLLNLCVNARDAMPDGGELIVALENFTVDEQFAAMTPHSRPGPHVIIAVSDTGAGIPREIIEKIFDPFFTTKEVGKGTGLGLSAVIGIVKSHGGFLTVDSHIGRGATFKVFLPATGGQSTAAASAAEEDSLPLGHGELVLVVDDEASILQITQTILEKYRYRVLTAVNGADAVALFATQMGEIKVILADVMMPIMDGLALARVLKRMSPRIPVIACSGQCEEVREANLKESGAKMLLRKPYNTGKLLTALRTVLDAPASS